MTKLCYRGMELEVKFCKICYSQLSRPMDKQVACRCGARYDCDEGFVLDVKWVAGEIERLRDALSDIVNDPVLDKCNLRQKAFQLLTLHCLAGNS